MTQITSYTNFLSRYENLLSQPADAGLKAGVKDMESLGLGESFGHVFAQQMDRLNTVQLNADSLAMDFASGRTEDLHQVMIAAEEARISMELAVQVRNKIVEAYKELSSMQL